LSGGYGVEDVEEAVCKRGVTETFEAQSLEDGECLVEFIFGEDAILRTVAKGLFNYL
jgi:hypothetical protein